MAVTLTGAKYASATLSGAGTTTVTVGSTPFVSGDFAKQRVVGLWDSTGATFKGMAYVRRYVSTSQLELETEVFDPVDGSIVTQTTGDILLVSKDYSECVTTGLAVSGRVVTLTDSIVYGTASDPDSLCFYDEDKFITTNVAAGFQAAGGLVVHGHLQSFSRKLVSQPCNIYSTQTASAGTPDSVLFKTTNSAAHWFHFGGNFTASDSPLYVGGYDGAAPGSLVFMNIYCELDLLSPSAGGSWGGSASRCVLNNIFAQSKGTNAILVRWGDGVISGGNYKFPGYTSDPLAIFGTDNAGTYAIGADPGERLVVTDMGNGNHLYRTNATQVITVNATNVISTDKGCIGGTTDPNSNATLNFYFEDRYTNLVTGTVGVITLDADSSTVDSISSVGADGLADLTVYHEQYVGFTLQFTRGPWTYGFKKYGYDPASGAIAEGTYDLGTAGTADDVSFGGPIIQIADDNVTLSAAAAAALTTVDDLDELYDATIYWGASSTTNAVYPSVSAYPVTSSGTVLDYGSADIIFNSGAGSAFSINTGTGEVTAKPASTVNAGAKFDTLKTTGAITGFTGSSKIQSATLDFPSAGSYTGTYIGITADFSATGTFNLTGATISGTIDLTNSSGGAVTVQLTSGVSYTNTGPNITVSVVAPSLTVSVTGMTDAAGANNRAQIINTSALTASAWQATTVYSAGAMRLRTTGVGSESTAGLYFRCTTAGTSGGTEPTWNTTVGGTTTDGTAVWTTYAVLFYDQDPASTSISTSYFEGEEFAEGESYEFRFAEEDPATSFKTDSTTGLATASGINILASPSADSVYADNGLSGVAYESTYSPDYTNDYIVLDTNTDYSIISMYAYYCYLLTQSQGMYDFWGTITAIDTGNYRNNDQTKKAVYLNETGGFVKQTDSARFFNESGTRPAIDPTTGGSGLEVNWRNPVYVQNVGGSALTTAESTMLLTTIPAKTNLLSSSVSGLIDVNCEAMNTHLLQGDGSESDKIRTVNAP